MKNASIIFCSILFLLSFNSCKDSKKSTTATKKRKAAKKKNAPSVSNISLIKGELVIVGKNLGQASTLTIKDSSEDFNQQLVIKSITKTKIVATGIKEMAVMIGAALNLVITSSHANTYRTRRRRRRPCRMDAEADNKIELLRKRGVLVPFFRTRRKPCKNFHPNDDDGEVVQSFPISFEIDDGYITAAMLSDMGAKIGQVLKFNGASWVPGDLSGLQYAGTWNASLKVEPSDSPAAGEYYIVNVAGDNIDFNDGQGLRGFKVGDWIVYNSVTTSWDKIDNASAVTSFNGRKGTIIPMMNDYNWEQINKEESSISDIADVDTTSAPPEEGDILSWNGASWVPANFQGSAGQGLTEVDSKSIIDGAILNEDISDAASISQNKIAGLQSDLAKKFSIDGSVAMAGDLKMGNYSIEMASGKTIDGVDLSLLETKVAAHTKTLAEKESSLPEGTISQYFRGDKSWQDLDTDAIAEGSKLFFKEDRVLKTKMAGYLQGPNEKVTPSDSVLNAIGKVESQIANTKLSLNGLLKADGSVALTGDLDLGSKNITNINSLSFKDNLKIKKVGSQGQIVIGLPSNLQADVTLILPATTGTKDQVLTTNGQGILNWSDPAKGKITGVSSTGPINVVNGDSSPVLSINQASSTQSGYLSSSDYDQFNSKQNKIILGDSSQYMKGDLTLGNFKDDVKSIPLTNFQAGVNNTVTGNDTIASSISKLQGQINNTVPISRTINGKSLAANVEITKKDIGLENTLDIKDMVDANISPTANDDSSDGYSVGSRWVDTAAGKAYICLMASPGNAIWKQISYDGSDKLSLDGSNKMVGKLDMNNNQVENLPTPIGEKDAANKAYVDAATAGIDDLRPLSGLTAASGMYDNRITDISPSSAYVEVCFKGGAIATDSHDQGGTTAGGNCEVNDVGYIIEKNDRSSLSWDMAKVECLKNGMRLLEAFEWKLSCNESSIAGQLSNMNNDWEWVSNSVTTMYQDGNYGLAAPIMGNTNCKHAAWGWLAYNKGSESSFTYRCAR